MGHITETWFFAEFVYMIEGIFCANESLQKVLWKKVFMNCTQK